MREYCRLLQIIAEYCRVLQSVTDCNKVSHSVTECYRVLQSIFSASTWTNFLACFWVFLVISWVGSRIYKVKSANFDFLSVSCAFLYEITLQVIDTHNIECLDPFLPF